VDASSGFHQAVLRSWQIVKTWFGVREVAMGSERSFGLVFAIVFTTIALWPLVGGGTIRLWALLLAAAFVILGWAWPAVMRPLNVAWFRFGLLIGAVTTPIVMRCSM
jgi:hypothetical protein